MRSLLPPVACRAVPSNASADVVINACINNLRGGRSDRLIPYTNYPTANTIFVYAGITLATVGIGGYQYGVGSIRPELSMLR